MRRLLTLLLLAGPALAGDADFQVYAYCDRQPGPEPRKFPLSVSLTRLKGEQEIVSVAVSAPGSRVREAPGRDDSSGLPASYRAWFSGALCGTSARREAKRIDVELTTRDPKTKKTSVRVLSASLQQVD